MLSNKKLDEQKIILIPPPPSDREAWLKHLRQTHGNSMPRPPKDKSVDREYYDAARGVAAELKVDTVDIWDDLDHPDMFRDGLHFSERGNAVLFERLWPLIEKRTSALPTMFPDWKEL